MPSIRAVSERLAQRISRRGLIGRGADAAFGILIGTAAGTTLRATNVSAGALDTVCIFPARRPCPCETCLANGTCAKPCIINTIAYASGCWVEQGITCCDCECQELPGRGDCGCGTDWHNDPENCPDGNAG